MTRDPSIHITRKRFEEILKELEIDYFPTGAFFQMARRNSADTRVLVCTNNKTTKQVSKVTLASHGDANLVADIIYATRIKLKQRGVRKITEANVRDWSLCKKLADICNSFCEDFGLETREGFIAYIETGIGRLNSYKNIIQRLIAMSENIIAQYDSIKEIRDYETSESIKRGVKDLHDFYVSYIASSTGIYEDFSKNPEKYVHFCRIHELLATNNWNYRDYIVAQFEALSFCSGVPSPETMYGDKALERFNKFKYKKNTSRGNLDDDVPQIEGSLWSKINKKS